MQSEKSKEQRAKSKEQRVDLYPPPKYCQVCLSNERVEVLTATKKLYLAALHAPSATQQCNQ